MVRFKKIYVPAIAFFLLFIVYRLLFNVSTSYAQYVTCTQYNCPGIVGQLVVDKQVRNPVTGVYVDNLGLQDPHYFADNAVFFRISVQNTSTTVLTRVTVNDYLPPFLSFVSGGSYSANNRQIVFYFDNVAPNERRSTVIQVKVNPLSTLPASKSLLCPVNRVSAYATEGGTDSDSSQLCIQKTVMAQNVPQTGDPFGLVIGLGSLPMLLAGYQFGKKRT